MAHGIHAEKTILCKGSYFCELRSFYQLILANLANQKSWWSIKPKLQHGVFAFCSSRENFHPCAHIPQKFQKTSLFEDESIRIRRVNIVIVNPILLVFFITHIYNKNVWEVILLNHFHLQCFFGETFRWIREMFSLSRNLWKATFFTSNSPKTPYHLIGLVISQMLNKIYIQNSPTPRVFLWFFVKSPSKSSCFINHFFVKTFMSFVGWNFYSWMIW